MSEPRIIVIGAGLAGLSAAIYARLNGFRCTVFEQHNLPGGVCTAWNRRGYTIDGCIHWLMWTKPGSSMYEVYRELGLVDAEAFMPLTHYARFVDTLSGKSLTVDWDLHKLEAELLAISPDDAAPIHALCRAIERASHADMLIADAPELAGAATGLRQLWMLRSALPVFAMHRGSVEEWTKRLRSPLLARMLQSLFLPELPMFAAILALGHLVSGKMGVFRGGSLEFSRVLERRLDALGGELVYGAMVEKVLVDGKKAIGVRLSDGSEHRADLVVSAADGRSTIFDLLDGRFIDDKLKSRYETWPRFRPVVMASFGCSYDFRQHVPSSTFFLRQPFETPGRSVDSLHTRHFAYDPTLAPAGNTVLQVLLESDWDSWFRLRSDRLAYKDAKEAIADAVLERLEEVYPGLQSSVEVRDVATPYTMWRYTRNDRGAYEGWLPTTKSFFASFDKKLPGLEQFYMIGQWTTPGGGIPPALCAGRHLLQLLCKERKQRFKSA